MVKYTCESCGARLETEGEPGTHEGCPTCHQVNAIPQPAPSMFARLKQRRAAAKQAGAVAEAPARAAAERQTRAAEEELQARAVDERQARAAEEERWRRELAARRRVGEPTERLSLGLGIGILLILAGIITTIACAAMDIGVRVGHDQVANLDKMNQRLLGVVIGVGLFIAGVVAVYLSSIHFSLWKIARHAQADMRDDSSTNR